jgi:hypothetical protein
MPTGPGGDTDTTGRLIDFDHAKVTETFAPVKYYDLAVARIRGFKELLSDDPRNMPYSIDDDVVFKALRAVGPLGVLHYVPEVITMRRQFFNLGLQGKVTPADLHWNKSVSTT